MKKILSLTVLILAFAGAAFAQGGNKDAKHGAKMEKRKPAAADKQSGFDASGAMTRGAALSKDAELVALADVLAKPAEYAGKTVLVEGTIVRSCKMEGCWMELAPAVDAAKSVRVTFKNHEFFIPLDAAGLNAKAEGVFSVKTLSKEQVEHLVKDDGAKFENVNADGTVTEISFEATGVRLTKPSGK
jgi:hypothetical protein